jgi:oligopeptide/dipeptide ABC transporter ATP-binding protein
MYAGQIVEEGAAADVVRAPKHPYTAALLAALPTADRKVDAPVGGEPPDPTRFPTGCRFHVRCPLRLPQCALDMPVLEGFEHRAACHLKDFHPDAFASAVARERPVSEHRSG